LWFVEDDVEHDLHRFSGLIRRAKRIVLAGVLAVSAAGMIPSCTSMGSGASSGGEGGQLSPGYGGASHPSVSGGSGGKMIGSQVGNGGALGTGGQASNGLGGSSGGSASGGRSESGGVSGNGGSSASASGGVSGLGGSHGGTGGVAMGGSAGTVATGGTTSTAAGSGSSKYVVAMLESTQAEATDITQDEIRDLVTDAVSQAGGFGFLKTGQTVVVKPNLLVSTSDGIRTLLPVTVNGVTADWRVTKAVTELVRAQIGTSGKLLIMEGSTESTTQAFSRLGYTAANFGSDVDEFIPLEGTSCIDRTTTGLVQKATPGGKQYWINQRYLNADAVISVACMKTHIQAGITGGVKNLGIGTTPASQYATSGCTRDQINLIPHSPIGPLSSFIADYYSLRPADFVVMDALQGIQHGPLPAWGGGNYKTDKMNMRLILASSNAVALDTVESLVMKCDPTKVPYLTTLEAQGYGTTDIAKIMVVGKQISDVAKPFAGGQTAVCPGK
jgi:uncharacterized protein (DUF362 family)